MSDDQTTLNTEGLDKLLKALKGPLPVGRVGILDDGNTRKDGKMTNAGIGTVHEFGTSQLPMRSFLRVPISDNLQKYMKSSGVFTPEALKAVIAKGNLVPWVKAICLVAEQIVFDGFGSGGFGKWRPSNMARKTNHNTLIETGQLRDSITSEVKESA